MSEFWNKRPTVDAVMVGAFADLTNWLASLPPEKFDAPEANSKYTIDSITETSSGFVINYRHEQDFEYPGQIVGTFGQYVILSAEQALFHTLDAAAFEKRYEPVQ